jgi:hypothetical protein
MQSWHTCTSTTNLSIEFWSRTGYYYSISCTEIKHGIYWGMVSLSRIIFYCKVCTQGSNYFQITGRARSVYSKVFIIKTILIFWRVFSRELPFYCLLNNNLLGERGDLCWVTFDIPFKIKISVFVNLKNRKRNGWC